MDLEQDGHYRGAGWAYRLSRSIQKKIVTACEYLAFALCKKSLVASNFFVGNIAERYGAVAEKAISSALGFDLERVCPQTPIDREPGDPKMILSVSRLVRSKNIFRIIEILEHLPESYRWTILGGGPEHDAFLEALNDAGLKDRVDLPGPVENVADYYARCDAFVHLSYYENFGLVLIEAMVNGKPPIVLRSDNNNVRTATREIVTDRVNGFFVEDDPFEVAKLIRETCDGDVSIIADQARKDAISTYSFSAHLQRLTRLIKDIALPVAATPK
jgi:glycosyltransferase involved in cell wall biosynthesis